ncbi:MAG: PAS domain S-box protein, partial [Bacteroidales bacterium]|nr:PAS domain S-box protein [Bacteroidales bacterium]
GSLFAIFMGRGITKGLRHLLTVADEITAGNEKARIDLDRNDELGTLGENLNTMIESLFRQKNIIQETKNELQTTKDEIEISEASLNALINNREASIWSIDQDYNYQIINDFFRKEYLETFGIDLQKGMSVFGILKDDLISFWKPKYQTAMDGDRVIFEFSVPISGNLEYFETYLNPIISEGIITGVTCLSINITNKKKSEIALKQSELNFKTFSTQSTEGISVSDLKGNYTFVNPAFCKMVGWSKEELLKMTVFDVTADKQDTETFKKTKTIEEGIPVEVILVRKDGSEFLAEIIGKNIIINEDKRVMGTIRDITERKKDHIALLESEKQYRLLFNLLPYGGEVINTKGIIIKCSPNTAKLLGYDISELTGKPITQFIDSDSKKVFKENFPKILNGESASLEISMIKKDGTKIHVLRAAQPIFNDQGKVETILALNLDITNRIEAENEIRISRANYRSIFENSPVPLWEEDFTDLIAYIESIKKKGITDLRTYFDQNPEEVILCSQKVVIKNVNNASLQLHKVSSKDDLIGNLDKIFTEKSLETFKEEVLCIANGELEFDAETEVKTLDGEIRHILIRLFIEERHDDTYQGLVATTDISERKKTEALLEKQTIELKERNEDLDAFSHTVAHDLKNPLALIAGFDDLIQKDFKKLNENDIQTYIQMIIKSGIKTQEIIKGLLLLANVRKSDIQIRALDMKEIVEESINRLSPLIDKSNAYIELPKEWPIVMGNAIWVEEVWVNFISNAIKYGGDTPIIEIGIIEKQEKGMQGFWIKDHGDGITEENKKLLFRKFERFDQVKTEGHGLGLSIVRNIIEKLGGKVGVDSEIGSGSTFYFSLPINSAHHSSQPVDRLY